LHPRSSTRKPRLTINWRMIGQTGSHRGRTRNLVGKDNFGASGPRMTQNRRRPAAPGRIAAFPGDSSSRSRSLSLATDRTKYRGSRRRTFTLPAIQNPAQVTSTDSVFFKRVDWFRSRMPSNTRSFWLPLLSWPCLVPMWSRRSFFSCSPAAKLAPGLNPATAPVTNETSRSILLIPTGNRVRVILPAPSCLLESRQQTGPRYLPQ